MESLPKKAPPPPGQKMIERLSNRTKWLLLAPVGLLFIGYGLCVFSEAGHLKHSGQPTIQWVLMGTYSLVLINAGLSIFGQAVRFRILMDIQRENRKTVRKMERKMESHFRLLRKKRNPSK
jgi:hypothetical protein